jgi:hypothetical protein
VEYAYRYRDAYRFVLWASAASEDTLRAAYVMMADHLQLPERMLQEQEKIITAVRHWLATHDGWLLVVDNADELERVGLLLPTGDKGHLLLTTRDQVVGGMESFVVKPMDGVEGTVLLLRRAGILKARMDLKQVSLVDQQVAEELVAELGGLPLALDQAGAGRMSADHQTASESTATRPASTYRVSGSAGRLQCSDRASIGNQCGYRAPVA